jgi:hypothetical protein
VSQVPTVVAIILSVTAILFFGEVSNAMAFVVSCDGGG